MSAGSSTTSATSIPMAALSAPWLPKHAIGSLPTEGTTASSSNTTTTLEITIVTSEEVSNGSNGTGIASSTTTTIERKMKLRLTLPSSYDTQTIKSMNVKLTSPDTTKSCFEQQSGYGNYCSQGSMPSLVSPDSSPSSAGATAYGMRELYDYRIKDALELQQQRLQENLHMFQGAHNGQGLFPETVASSQGCVRSTHAAAMHSSTPRPETVSSSSPPVTISPNSIPATPTHHDIPNSPNGNKRSSSMRYNEAVSVSNRTIATVQPTLPRKKRKTAIAACIRPQ